MKGKRFVEGMSAGAKGRGAQVIHQQWKRDQMMVLNYAGLEEVVPSRLWALTKDTMPKKLQIIRQ